MSILTFWQNHFIFIPLVFLVQLGRKYGVVEYFYLFQTFVCVFIFFVLSQLRHHLVMSDIFLQNSSLSLLYFLLSTGHIFFYFQKMYIYICFHLFISLYSFCVTVLGLSTFLLLKVQHNVLWLENFTGYTRILSNSSIKHDGRYEWKNLPVICQAFSI